MLVRASRRWFSSSVVAGVDVKSAMTAGRTYIGGEWVQAQSGATFSVLDPATLKPIGAAPDMGAAETELAIAAAVDALPGWQAMLAKDRAVLLRRWYDLILEHADDLAEMVTLECGKPLTEAKGEILYGASFIDWFAEEGKRMYGEVIPETMPGRRLMTFKQPVGVCGLLTPFNFPNAMMTRKAGPALAAGCTVVMKPAEDTPFSIAALCMLAEEAGIPPGVINSVTCSRDNVPHVADVLAQSSDVRKLSFTGSTAVGSQLMAAAAPTLKRLSLELGGNAPFIVFDDADVDAAVEGALASKFRNSGQTCVCANRFFVHDSVYDEFASKFAARVAQLKLGHGLDDGVQLGPLINDRALTKVSGLVDDAVAKGATVLTGGDVPADTPGGHFYNATVLTDVTLDMRVAQEEIFGPIAPLIRFGEEASAVEMANMPSVGLAGYFYSRDVGRIFRVAEALEVGMVAVNEGILSTEVAPFGGMKRSGFGKEGARQGLLEYVEEKYLCLGGL